MSSWTSLGSPARVRLAELGPGRGTLMSDLLRTAKRFPHFYDALSVHMVEVSKPLSGIQASALASHGDIVQWHPDFASIPSDEPMLIIAQEFFDAFPVHQLQKTDRGWCERLVDVDDSPDSHLNFRMVLSPSPTPASTMLAGALAEESEMTGIEVSPSTLALAQEVISHTRKSAMPFLCHIGAEQRPHPPTFRHP